MNDSGLIARSECNECFLIARSETKIVIKLVLLQSKKKWWPRYWPTGRLTDNQKIRNLTEN